MLLKKITLTNYGLYRGVVHFELAPREKYGKIRPVVLFGGKNGAGKTTLFDAFRVVLYGKTALGTRISEQEYKTFLKNKIHRSPQNIIQPTHASITLEFDHVVTGEINDYVVTRGWSVINGNNVTESLSITQNGKKLGNVNNNYWQGFVEEIIPERLSSLFFFDGEKIKNIADDENGNKALAESIKTLLGIDVVDRLRSDLNIYKGREAQKFSDEDFRNTIDSYNLDIENIKEKIEKNYEDLAANQTAIDGVASVIAQYEKKLHQEGYVFAQNREQLISEKSSIKANIDEVTSKIRKEYEGVYPLSFCPRISRQLCVALAEEQRNKKGALLKAELESMEKSVLSTISKKGAVDLVKEVSQNFAERIQEISPKNGFSEIFSFSDAEVQQIFSWIESAEKEAAPHVAHLKSKYEEQTRKLQNVERELLKAPEDSILSPIVAELQVHNKRLGALQEERSQQAESLRVLEFKLSEAQRKLNSTISAQKSTDDAGKRVELAERVQAALVTYADNLTRAKIAELRETVANCFNQLSRKGDLIREIDIDPDTFAVTLFDRYGNALPKEELSAGEKQMYAVAMLWGLSITSGRTLPVIIDTPLGRLDSDHRRKLISSYFPQASKQVIILSTDTEIDQQWYKELSPNLSHSYHLSYSSAENNTMVTTGYFWRQ